MFFFLFAAIQIPLGMALDRFGPKICLSVGAAVTVLGCIAFASAASTQGLIAGRALMGLGAAGALVGALTVYARRFPAHRFATLTGLQVGVGTVGALIATAPLGFSAATIGWRGSFLAVAAFAFVVGCLIVVVLRKDGAHYGRPESVRESLAGTVAVLRTPSIGRLFAMSLVVYSTFGLVTGLWGGPYLAHVYGYGLERRGSFLFVSVIGQIVGSLAWGPIDRLVGSYKLPVLIEAVATAASLGPRAGWNVAPDGARAVVRHIRVCVRLWTPGDRARQVVVRPPPGRTRAHCVQYGHHGRDLFDPGDQWIRDRASPCDCGWQL